MLPERYRRLWRRRLHRRPLLPFLLAATLAVDGLKAAVPLGSPNEGLSNFALGLTIGQIGLLALWVVSRRFGVANRLGMAVLGMMALIAIVLSPNDLDEFDAVVAFGALALVASLAVCAGVKAVAAVWKRSAIRRRRRTRFSMGFLVGAMLVLPPAVLITRMDAWDWMLDGDMLVSIVLETALLGIMLSLSTAIPSPAFFGLVCLAGLLATAAFGAADGDQLMSAPYYLGHATILSAWLTGLKVRSRDDREAAREAGLDVVV